jgi:uncharacterized protein (TIGR00288 family)
MIPSNARGGVHLGAAGFGPGHPFHPAPNAALLIDFDNVTLGIQKDLGKELKALLNSDVIRGKVAVQRAYADWRRYPQYIVPLAESSIDLIFAPAYGPGKKNATDLRMAIDAMELVFTRPEIGTFILLTGDSDFSSCVLKLKEYGKYVIGVGMRESSSDLLIQNCDEYYSYHALSGLTRATEALESKEDPWVLVQRAAERMVKNNDVMRTDRLKQVMLDLDPGFDEKAIGYSKFSKFMNEAVNRGIIRVRRGENGQQEIVYESPRDATAAVAAPTAAPAAAAPAAAEEASERERRDRRDRHGRRRDRHRDAPRAERASEEPAEPAARAEEVAAAEPAPPVVPAEARREPKPDAAPAGAARIETPAGLEEAYALLQHALRQADGGAGAVRDAELKRKMLELAPGFDESKFGFAKFTRFLRQAHDAEVVDLHRQRDGVYEVKLGSRKLPVPIRVPREADVATPAPSAAPRAQPQPTEAAAPAAPAPQPREAAAPAGGIRGLRGRTAPSGPPPLLPGQVVGRPSEPPATAPTPTRPVTEAPPAAEPEAAAAPAAAPAAPLESGAVPETAAVAEAAPEPAAAPRPTRGRRGRGRGSADGPPPVLPGQAVGPRKEPALPAVEEEVAATVAAAPEAAAPAAEAADVEPTDETAAPGRPKKRRSRSRKKKEPRADAETTVEAAAEPAADAAALAEAVTEAEADLVAPPTEEPAPTAAPAKKRRSRGRKRTAEAAEPAAEAPAAESEAAAAPAGEAAFSPERLGLPTETDSIVAYLTNSYKGVGQKTAEPLAEAFGPDVFRVMQEEPSRVRDVLGDRRAVMVLERWAEDFARRAEAEAVEPEAAAGGPQAEAAAEANEPARRPRNRRGGRGRTGKRKDADGSA